MITRVDKCVKFGMKKVRTKSVQFQPKLFISSQLVPCVSTDSSFKCQGSNRLLIASRVVWHAKIVASST